jgi:hypothetical protein
MLHVGEKCRRRRQHKQNERCVFFSHGGRQGAVYSGTVAADEDAPIMKFFCGFHKGDGGDSLYGDNVSKDCLWKSRSN